MQANARHTTASDWGCDARKGNLADHGVTRRAFLRNGALALVGTFTIPAFLTRSVYAQSRAALAARKTLVVIFQRGACDGLNLVVPFGEPNYYAKRPSISLQEKDTLDLDGFFGLHPAMASLKPLWDSKHLGFVHAVGSPDPTRSHFDAQDYMESGTPGRKATTDGWLNRALAGAASADRSPFRAVALGPQVPRTLQGPVPSVAIANLQDFSIDGRKAETSAADAFQAMYDGSTDTVLHGTGQETFEAIRMLKATNPGSYRGTPGVTYPSSAFGNSMRQVAQLLKADLGVEAAFADVGGWDTHQNQGGVTGQLADRLRDFADSLSAFWRDMGNKAEDVMLVTMSEFGRTVHQNGTGGTDHGHANVMLVLGGAVKGGKVYGRWPGLADEQLNDARDLAVTTDFRIVLGEAVQTALGVGDLGGVFPTCGVKPGSLLRYS